MRTGITLACPAKVNLSLRVHGRRTDGFHEISTVLQTIDLCDRLSIRRVSSGRPLALQVPGGGAPTDDSNLVLSAARAFFDRLSRPPGGIRFRLRKRIPPGSGLGGGSSDAAAALAGLQQLLGDPLTTCELRQTAAAVGSDVPFFLVGGMALATGRGERVEPLRDAAGATVTVAVPGVELSTAAVYRRWRGSGAGGVETEGASAALLPPTACRGGLGSWVRGNDLEPVVRRLCPEVDRLVEALGRAVEPGVAGGPQVSGSGGSVFVVGRRPPEDRLRIGGSVQVFRTRTLPRSGRPDGLPTAWSLAR